MPRPPDAEKDRRLIGMLRANGRMSLTSMARNLGVARATVQARLERLEREKVILGYTVRLGEAPGRAPGLEAVVTIEVEARHQPRIVAALSQRPEVRACHAVRGPFDLLVRAHAPDAAQLDAVIGWMGALHGVRRASAAVVLGRKIER